MLTNNSTSQLKSIGLRAVLLAVLAILIMIAAPAPTNTQATANIQPELLALVETQPDAAVRVIVYKASDEDAALRKLITELEGTIVRDLQLINALAVELPAKAVPTLARPAGVAQISLDGAMVSASVLTETVRDEFNSTSFSNNDGTVNWAGNWIETGESDGPGSGDLRVYYSQLRIRDDRRDIERVVDLSGAETAVLSFDYRRRSLDRSTDFIDLEISDDGGSSWTNLDSFVGPANESSMSSASYNIIDFATSDTVIRFATSDYMGNYDYLYVDNLEITYTWSDSTPPPPPPPPPSDSTDGILRDEFTAVAFDGNNGDTVWASDWIENDPSVPGQDPTSGFVQITNGELRINNQDADDSTEILRAANLSGYVTNATLSFDFRTGSVVNTPDAISIEISDDGGANYLILETFDGIYGASSSSHSYDITRWATPNTIIRIRSTYNYSSTSRYFYFDNVDITYTVSDTPPPVVNRQTVADDFNAYPYNYANQSGTRNWLTDWQEISEDDGASAGEIYTVSYRDDRRLRLRTDRLAGPETWVNRGIWRTADLSGATQAELTFIYSRTTVESDDYLVIEASTDSGATWTEVERIGGQGSTATTGSDDGWKFAAVDISAFIGPQTAVRLITDFSPSDYYDTIYFDDITITFDDPTEVVTTNYYLDTLNVRPVWEMGYDGTGIGVAVVDSGVAFDDDFSSQWGLTDSSRVVAQIGFNQNADTTADNYGHGTHVAGIIGGNGTSSNGDYVGIAPKVNLIGIKVSDDYGMAYESDTVDALEWVLNNKDVYNIRVVNLSLNSTLEQSYNESALDAAVEILWLNDIVVVASAGNSWGPHNTVNASPANDPFIITVGASEEGGSADRNNDWVAAFTQHGITLDGFSKPEVIAPGKDIISVLASSSWWRNDYPERYIDGGYFRISGTSMAAPMVSGAVALLLQAEPNLTPDQVKYRLMNTGSDIYFNGAYPYMDVYELITTPTTESANADVVPHEMLAKMALIAYWASENGDETIDWANVDWDAVDWDGVDWNSVNWGSVNWGSVNWGSVNWGSVNWGSVNWGSVNWGSVNWGSVNWGSVNWGSVNWGSVNWGSVSWDD